jgi:PTH1 family peptidyl-tRNA hydrolase
MEFLIAGLGNYAPEYDHTRHNIGFDIVDRLAKRFGVAFESGRFAEFTQFRHKGKTFNLIKPTTFMNRSGKAVRHWLGKLQLKPERMLVLVDEVNLPLGSLRLRANGSDGGHNGLASIIEYILTEDFARLRFGIGNEYGRGQQSDYVLGKWSEEEWQVVDRRIDVAAEAALAFGLSGIDKAMNDYNQTAA